MMTQIPTRTTMTNCIMTNNKVASTPSALALRRKSMKRLQLCLLPTSKPVTEACPTPNIMSAPSSPLITPRHTKKTKSSSSLVTSTSIPVTPQHHSSYQHGPLAIFPYLYIGNEKNAHTLKHLDRIDCLLNVAAEVERPSFTTVIPWSDKFSMSSTTSTSLLSSNINTKGYYKLATRQHGDQLKLDDAMVLIDQAKKHNKVVLVHCQCGVARSATVVIAYVMHCLRIPLYEAYAFVQQRAPAIGPNLSLLYQLQSLEKKYCLEYKWGHERYHHAEETGTVACMSSNKKRKLHAIC